MRQPPSIYRADNDHQPPHHHPRTTTLSAHSKPGIEPTRRSNTWLEAEAFAYPSGAISAGRRARVTLRRNEHNPVDLPYGSLAVVAVGIADTFSTIPARLRHNGRTVRGFVSVHDELFTFTPDPAEVDDTTPSD